MTVQEKDWPAFQTLGDSKCEFLHPELVVHFGIRFEFSLNRPGEFNCTFDYSHDHCMCAWTVFVLVAGTLEMEKVSSEAMCADTGP